jgi:hypothetical protein
MYRAFEIASGISTPYKMISLARIGPARPIFGPLKARGRGPRPGFFIIIG